MPRRKTKGPESDARSRAKRVDAIAKAMSAFLPAKRVLSSVRSVPTRMIQLDHALRSGGWPIEVVAIASGPSNHGKTAFALNLLGSFLDLDHFGCLIDAERTTPIDFARAFIGPAADDEVFFKACRPGSYEEAVDLTESFARAIAKLRDAGDVSKETSGLVVVDSLRKLVPKGFFKAATKTDEADPMSGRGPMIKAKWNAAWLDSLVPLLDDTGTGWLGIGREYEDADADAWSRKMGTNTKLGGGKAVVFDSSVYVRIDRPSFVENSEGALYGERHRLTVKKTKVGTKDRRETVAYFHTSNGALVPAGHDRARDVLELARKFGLVSLSGSWFSWGKTRLGQGENNAVLALTKDGGMLADLESKVRAQFAAHDPAEIDPATTGEVE